MRLSVPIVPSNGRIHGGSVPNPFDDPSDVFLVLVNGEGQYSLWPTRVAIPSGWTQAKGKSSRDACLAHIDEHWTDMRPRSLAKTHRL
ncbi:MbtH family protein [Streptomyces sp. NPDC058812]|uniref:MbtH family protein n=1 Tax=unclassified Streptomyces TaxID=2593676 RepID=UPI0036A51ADC